MKKVVTICLLAISCSAIAQTDSIVKSQPSKNPVLYRKNEFKINASALLLSNISLWYERSLSSKISASVGFSTMGKTKLSGTPLGEKVLDGLVDEDDTDLDDIKAAEVGGNAYTAEVRFYTGKRKPGPRGFYVSLYGRKTKLDVSYPYTYETGATTYRVPVSGTFNGYSGGLSLGVKWIIAKRVSIDLCFLGAHYGHISGNFSGAANLAGTTASQKDEIKEDFLSVGRIAGKNITKDIVVTNSGVTGRVDGPMVGTLMGSLKIGIAF